MNGKHCYLIIVDGKKCFNYDFAQKQYEVFYKSKKGKIKVELFRFKNDLKPKYEFIISKEKPLNSNLFLQLLYLIEMDVAKSIKKVDEAKTEKQKLEEEEYFEMLKRAEEEAEEWYIDYVLEKEQYNDVWLYSLLLDPNDLEEFQYYSPADIVYMAYTLAQLERNSSLDYYDDSEEKINDISDIDIEDLVWRFQASCLEYSITPNFHETKVNQYVKLYENNPYIKNRILKNHNTYKNLHKIKALRQDKYRSI